MCGICGIIYSDKDKNVDKPTLARMNESLSHRGPDEEGYFLRGNAGLGMRRLSIIDVKGGHQPVYNEDKSVCVICNGEIYNHLQLREDLEKRGHHFSTHSDVEVIVHLYEEDPERFVEQLRGMFAIAIYDLNNEKLILLRDRLGIKPLYYTFQKGALVFASELKALSHYPGLEKNISLRALSDYLTFLYIPAPRTIFDNVYKLPPANTLVFKNGDLTLKQYWEIDYSKQEENSEEYYIDRLSSLLKESVKSHLMSEVPLGAFLSGGLDSSAIVALASLVSAGRMKTFSVGFDVSDFNELKYAKLVAERFNTEHHEINLTPDIIKILPKLVSQFDEPFADSSAIPTYLISEFARKSVTVCLSGDGGDELFAGYGWTRRQKFIDDYNRLPANFRNNLKRILLRRDYAPDKKNKALDKLRRFLYDANSTLEESFLRRITCFSEEMKKRLFKDSIYQQMNNYRSSSVITDYFNNGRIQNNLEKLLFLDTKFYLPDDGLCKVDRMSMLNSLEVRVPFLDHKVVEFAASIPVKYKMNGRISKYIVKKMMKGLLPAQILKQRKLGFTIPLNNWFRGKLKGFSSDLLLNERSKLRDFFSVDFIEWMIQEHEKGRQDFGYQLYSLSVLELWLR